MRRHPNRPARWAKELLGVDLDDRRGLPPDPYSDPPDFSPEDSLGFFRLVQKYFPGEDWGPDAYHEMSAVLFEQKRSIRDRELIEQSVTAYVERERNRFNYRKNNPKGNDLPES